MQRLQHLIFAGGFLPQCYCCVRAPGLAGLYVASDYVIAISYLISYLEIAGIAEQAG